MKKHEIYCEKHGLVNQDMSTLENYLREEGWTITSKSEKNGLLSISATRETDTFREEISRSEQKDVDKNNIVKFQSSSYCYNRTEKNIK